MVWLLLTWVVPVVGVLAGVLPAVLVVLDLDHLVVVLPALPVVVLVASAPVVERVPAVLSLLDLLVMLLQGTAGDVDRSQDHLETVHRPTASASLPVVVLPALPVIVLVLVASAPAVGDA